MNPLKLGIVGTGKVAQSNYLPYLAQQPGLELAYYNRSRDKAEACAGRFGGQVFDTPEALAGWQPDAVMILTREMDRYGAGMALLESSRPPRRIFFEKPLVARNGQENVTEQDFDDAKRMLRLAHDKGCETAMVFNYRFYEHTLLAKRIVAERDFGRALTIAGLVHYACWSHCIDLIHFFAGPIAEISALASQAVHDMGWLKAPDTMAAFRTHSDAAGTLIGSTTLAWDAPLYELVIGFERGRIRMQDLDGDLTVMDARSMEIEQYRIHGAKSRWDQYNASFQKSVRAYLESVRNNQPPPVPGEAGLLELQVEAGIRRSIALQRPVNLASEFPLV